MKVRLLAKAYKPDSVYSPKAKEIIIYLAPTLLSGSSVSLATQERRGTDLHQAGFAEFQLSPVGSNYSLFHKSKININRLFTFILLSRIV